MAIAKTRADYLTEGANIFNSGKAYPYSVSETSWQKRALLEGYEAAYMEAHTPKDQASDPEWGTEGQNGTFPASKADGQGVDSPTAADALAYGVGGLIEKPGTYSMDAKSVRESGLRMLPSSVGIDLGTDVIGLIRKSAICEHLRFLNREYMQETNAARCNRLNKKVQKLADKWSKRFGFEIAEYV